VMKNNGVGHSNHVGEASLGGSEVPQTPPEEDDGPNN
jgi:hypothetical protein